MKKAEPRHCVGCGLKRRAKAHGRHCYDCMPGGPFTPPPCRRCGTSENFFASGLCARCHLHGTIRVDACLDCHAWGTTRNSKWLCHGCVYWRLTHPTIEACASCHHVRSVNGRGICRLCWKSASGYRTSRGLFDPIGGNRHGQQLFLADMQKAAGRRRRDPSDHTATWPAGRPVTHRQLTLFAIPHDLSRGRLRLPPPRDLELAAALDVVAGDYGRSRAWGRTQTSKVRSGIRIVLGLQDTPGAPIRYNEMVDLPRLFINIRPLIEVLDSVGMFDDDRTPAISRWFSQQTVGLPAAMASELATWFEDMHNGSTSPPRRRPRSATTISVYSRAALPVLRRWADEGHESLREISRSQVLAALPREPARRKIGGQAMRSIFGILKDRKLIFANPAFRLGHANESPMPPPAVDLDAVRAALNSPDPARAAVAALVAYHGLRSHQLRNLRLTDLRDRHLHLDGRAIPVAAAVKRRIAAWLDHRAQRWPTSTNPYLFIHFRTAAHNEPVGLRWVYLTIAMPGGVQALRGDRILHEAAATGGDPRRLCDLFGLSIQHATRYTNAITEPVVPG